MHACISSFKQALDFILLANVNGHSLRTFEYFDTFCNSLNKHKNQYKVDFLKTILCIYMLCIIYEILLKYQIAISYVISFQTIQNYEEKFRT